MSGPKVIRVITREEMVAAAQATLARLDAALREWETSAHAGGSDANERTAAKDRRDALERTFRAEAFGEFSRGASAEIAFLEVDTERRIEKAAQARAWEKSRLESGRALAGFLLGQLDMPSRDSSSQERAALERAAAGELDLKQLDSVLAQARQSLVTSSEAKATESQKTLAARLGAGESTEDIETWRARSLASTTQVVALMTCIEKLELLGVGEKSGQFRKELQAACAVEEAGTRSMRLDSLVIAVSKAAEGASVVARLRRQCATLAAEAANVAGGEDLVKFLTAAGEASREDLQAAVQDAQTRLDAIRTTNTAHFRRRAVLAGLQQLGYEVQERMSTVTSASGRLVLRGSTDSTYGVEIVAGAEMGRMQVRTVALEAGRDTSGDVAAEQRWCDEFGKLQSRLEAEGNEVVIEKALGVGAVPVKELESVGSEDRRRTATAKSMTRR